MHTDEQRRKSRAGCDTSAGLPASQAITLKSAGEQQADTNRQMRCHTLTQRNCAPGGVTYREEKGDK